MGTSLPETQSNNKLDPLNDWPDRFDRGRDLIKQTILGLALLWQEYTDRNETDSIEYADLSLQLGRHLRAVSDRPFDWWRLSGLHEGHCYALVGQALLAMDPEPQFSERIQSITKAYAVIGQRGAGKGTFLGFLDELGVKCAPSSDVLRSAVRAKLLIRDGEIPELIQEGIELKNRFGDNVLVRWTFNRLWNLYGTSMTQIAIDGLRSDEELEGFKKLFGDKAIVVAIDTPPERLWGNLLIRFKETGRIDYATYADFLKTQAVEYERISALLAKPGVIRINNSGSLADLKTKAVELVKKQ